MTAGNSAANCSKCGGKIEIDETQNYVKCPYCETIHSVPNLLNESENVQIEKIRSQTQKDILDKKVQFEMLLESERKRKERETEFKKSKIFKLLIIFAVLAVAGCVYAFSQNAILSGITAIIQTGLFLCAWLMGMQVIEEKKHNLKVIPIIIACLLVVPYFIFMPAEGKKSAEKLKWDEIVLAEYLPNPEADKCRIISNTEDSLSIIILDITAPDYKKYKDACADMNFTVDQISEDNQFSAYNSKGYFLKLAYSGSEEMTIDLTAPKKLSEISWPNSQIGKEVPPAESKIGIIDYDNEDSFGITVGNTTKEQFNTYIKTCSDKGFNIDYSKSDNSYEAYNSKNDYLSISYIGNNMMSVKAKSGNDESTTKETTTVSTTESAVTTTEKPTEKATQKATGLRPEFKKAMDSYEEFMNEYVDFMKNYAESDNPISMLQEYTEYLEKYGKAVEDFDNWDSDDLSPAEAAYYLEVQTRISKKMMDVD